MARRDRFGTLCPRGRALLALAGAARSRRRDLDLFGDLAASTMLTCATTDEPDQQCTEARTRKHPAELDAQPKLGGGGGKSTNEAVGASL